MRLAAAYQKGANGLTWDEIAEGNQQLIKIWAHLMQKLAGTVPGDAVGWLDPHIGFRDLDAMLRDLDLTRFALSRPKPEDARERDPSMNPPTARGAAPPLRRVDEM